MNIANTSAISADAEKPEKQRVKNRKYRKKNNNDENIE